MNNLEQVTIRKQLLANDYAVSVNDVSNEGFVNFLVEKIRELEQEVQDLERERNHLEGLVWFGE